MRVAVGGLDDLVRNALLFLEYFVELAPHEPLDRENRILRIGDGLTFRGLSDQPLTALCKCNH